MAGPWHEQEADYYLSFDILEGGVLALEARLTI
jgi:hypothetical protein